MNRAEVENGIQRSWKVLEDLGLAESFSVPGVLEINEEFRDLALGGAKRYSELYLTGLRQSYYNILLLDFSFLQFSWSGENAVRYAYYPNPFISGDADLLRFRKLRKLFEEGAIGLEDYYTLLDETPPEGRIPLLRYENAPDQWKELSHPCSHLHVGFHGDNRWPFRRLLTPLAFTLFVSKQYYSTEWTTFGTDDNDEFGNVFENKLVLERMNCHELGDALFTAKEARTFHLA